jgi:hypothetical protein
MFKFISKIKRFYKGAKFSNICFRFTQRESILFMKNDCPQQRDKHHLFRLYLLYRPFPGIPDNEKMKNGFYGLIIKIVVPDLSRHKTYSDDKNYMQSTDDNIYPTVYAGP